MGTTSSYYGQKKSRKSLRLGLKASKTSIQHTGVAKVESVVSMPFEETSNFALPHFLHLSIVILTTYTQNLSPDEPVAHLSIATW